MPAESRHLRVVFRFPDCDFASTPTRHVVRDLPVAYRIQGRARSALVEFVEGALSVKASGTCDNAFPSGTRGPGGPSATGGGQAPLPTTPAETGGLGGEPRGDGGPLQ